MACENVVVQLWGEFGGARDYKDGMTEPESQRDFLGSEGHRQHGLSRGGSQMEERDRAQIWASRESASGTRLISTRASQPARRQEDAERSVKPRENLEMTIWRGLRAMMAGGGMKERRRRRRAEGKRKRRKEQSRGRGEKESRESEGKIVLCVGIQKGEKKD